MLDERDLFGEETRVAVVDPGTGIDLDGTRITRGGIAPPSERRPTAQFLPTTGMRETGEITSMWTSSPPMKVRVMSRIRFLMDRITFARGKLLITLAAAAMITVAIVAAFAARRATSGNAYQAVSAAPAEDVSESQAPLSETVQAGNYSASLGEAVSALLDGHLEEALGHYEALLGREPGDESVEQAVRILRRRIGGESQ